MIFLQKEQNHILYEEMTHFYSTSELCMSRNRILVVFGTKSLRISAV